MIVARELSKTYAGTRPALDALDLTVEAGEIYCLLGANGAGKTTTINLFLNFIEPTRGQALLNGIDVARDPLKAKRYVAYLSENVALYGNFTARQNLDFFTRLGGGAACDDEGYRQALRRVGLPDELLTRRVHEFSKGMRQKLGIAIAVAKEAPALLLDEPMSGLDPQAAVELVATLEGLRRDGKAILMSTHDVFRAKEMADRVGIMKEGRKVAELNRAELRGRNLEQLYLDYMRGEAVEQPAAPAREPAGGTARQQDARRSPEKAAL